jgi:hypothetical protein
MKISVDLKIVPIEKVKPNAFNPKLLFSDDAPTRLQYEQVKKSIEKHGLNAGILVRTIGDHFEIIDGFHRYTACQELGYKEILVNDLGEVSDYVAKQLLLNREAAFIEVDDLLEAKLLKEINQFHDLSEMSTLLPYDEKMIAQKIEMYDYEWLQMTGSGEHDESLTTLHFVFDSEEDYAKVVDRLTKYGGTTAEALYEICKMYGQSKS